jgi:hypothetical protein
MSESQPQSKPSKRPPEGRILETRQSLDGLSSVKIDNGPLHTITILTRTEDLEPLLGTDLADIRAHLMTRRSGHFRSK